MRRIRTTFPALILAVSLAGTAAHAAPKHLAPIPAATLATMQASDVAPDAPILVRAFKREGEMEVWKKARSGRYALVKTFPICRWSGQLGPKRTKGDRQTPEGFYGIPASQMVPGSAYHLAFDTGFPNAYDKAHRSSGSALMVHGACSSSGCFAMTDQGIEEIYALAREAFAGGQGAFQFQSFPFRMTAENLVRFRNDANVSFWGQLKEGYDRFEATGEEPTVATGGGRYVFLPYQDRVKEKAAIDRLNRETLQVAALLTKGTPAFRITYGDGGQHPSFKRAGTLVGEVSRPEALQVAGLESMIPGTSGKQSFSPPVLRTMPPAPPPALAAAPSLTPSTDSLPDILRQALALSAVPAKPLGQMPGSPGFAPVPPALAPVMAQAPGEGAAGQDKGMLATAAIAEALGGGPAAGTVQVAPPPPAPVVQSVRRF